MILTSLRAENVLKYERLLLERLPAQGVVAVSGYNESGKSTIGETICFSLFGRTFSLNAAHIAKIVRWGETRCSVSVAFRIGDTDYRLTRALDKDGNHSARLSRLGDENHPIARGPAAVATALEERLGYDFNEFIESFYLAQREITTPHPHSEAVKIMAGLAPLERVTREFQGEVEGERRGIADAEAKIAGIDGVQARLRDVQSFEIKAREARRHLAFPALELGWQQVEQSGQKWSGPVYGFAWKIPLFDRRQGDRLASARRLDAATAKAELATRRSNADAEAADSAYAVLRDAAMTAAGSLEDGDRLVESATAAYDLGEADTTDLLETLRSVLRARLTALELHADALAAHRALEIAAGRPLLPSEGDNR